MNNRTKIVLLAVVLTTAFTGVIAGGQFAIAKGQGASKESVIEFTDTFFLEDCNFSSKGSNRFFILEPNYQLVLSGKGQEEVELAITVLDETKTVDGVKTRVVEERETVNDELVEVSKNYFAICEQTNSVFYFGEDVDFYENGEIVSHAGSWLAGEDDAKAGLMMPGLVLLGSRYHQETAPNVATDRAEIVSIEEVVDTPAGEFEDVLKTKETTPFEPSAVEYKYHAAGIGLIQDQELKLEKYGFIE